MIKPINFFIIILVIVLFAIAISFTTKVDLENVNIHRDVSTLNQRTLNIANIEEKMLEYSKKIVQEVDSGLKQAKQEIINIENDIRKNAEQDRNKVNALENKVKSLEVQVQSIRQENQQLKQELRQINDPIKP